MGTVKSGERTTLPVKKTPGHQAAISGAVKMWRVVSKGVHSNLRTVCCKAPGPTGHARIAGNEMSTSSGPAKKKSRLFPILGGTAFLVAASAGGAVAYAWMDPEFRKKLEDTFPEMKDVLNLILPAESPKATSTPPQSKTDTNALKFGDVEQAKRESLARKRPKVAEETPPIKPAEMKPVKEEPPKPSTKTEQSIMTQVQTDKEKERAEVEARFKRKQQEEASENAALEIYLENILESSKRSSESAMDLQQKVISATKKHTELLKKAMDDTTEILNKDSQWQAVSDAFQERQTAATEAEKMLNATKSDLEKLKEAISDGKKNKVTKGNKALIPAQETHNKLMSEMQTTANKVSKCEAESKGMLKYKDLVEQGRKQFKKELESVMPDVKIGQSRGKLTEEELNSLIAHAHRRIDQLQKQLAEQMALEQQRLQKTLDQQRDVDEKVGDQRVDAERNRLKNIFDVDKQKWDIDAKVQFENDLRHQLSRQAAAHSDHIKEVLKVQEKELNYDYEKKLNLKMLEERQAFQTEIAGWVARLRGIEAGIESRAAAEKVARQAQDLWLASLALNGVIKRGREEKTVWEEKLKPLGKEIIAIGDAANNHPFVNIVLSTIPEHAVERGVWTEDDLKERFWNVRRVCKRVAMIDETGGSLFKYFVSYLQSFFMFPSVQAKSLNDEVDIGSMDNFNILANASYWLEKGEFETAVRYMNQLQGESRRVASDWLKEAKLLLETRQAAFALTAFASASGLGTVF